MKEKIKGYSNSQSRSQSRTHSRNHSRTFSRGQSRNCARANSQSCSQGDLLGMHPQSPDGPLPRRKVTFHDLRDEKDPTKEEAGCSTEPSIDDLEDMVGVLGRTARHSHMVGRAGSCARH